MMAQGAAKDDDLSREFANPSQTIHFSRVQTLVFCVSPVPG
jgi:hypothetical protein